MNNRKYIVSLDQGTTGSRTLVLDQQVNIVSIAQRNFPQIYPGPGWVEHDPREIWATQSATLTEALAKAGITSDEVAAIVALPTSAKPLWSGKKRQESPFTMPLSGNAAAQPISATV